MAHPSNLYKVVLERAESRRYDGIGGLSGGGRNPDIFLYCLPWAFPAWVGAGKRDPYHKPELTATYVIKYIQGARKYYNLTMDYVGIWNERAYNSNYIKIVAADGLWEPIATDILLDKELANAVDIIGVHYPGTKTTQLALDTGKPLWSSEDYSTFNDNVGAGCWARIINQNYVVGNMTSTISWNLIASYYEALPFKRNGLMTADSPWSGYYRVDAPIWMTAHTTQFAWPGWYYAPHGHGSTLLEGGGSMVSLISWDNTQISIIIETMTVVLNYFQVVNGQVHLSIGVDEVYTLHTLQGGTKGSYPNVPDPKPFPLPYTDDFEVYKIYKEPFNFSPQVGSFEVLPSEDVFHTQILRQTVIENPIYWCLFIDLVFPIGLLGDYSWSDIYVEVDAKIGLVNATSGVKNTEAVSEGPVYKSKQMVQVRTSDKGGEPMTRDETADLVRDEELV
ncbi:GALC-like protein [Mya arenaria]|uniref:GALC-like protein n=1 Tax=Mya arenaria TaxID=6604 RepID=A0ABY7FH70_MYAAR|nr:GALC-like protein [Mya arenaria]